MRDRIVLPIPPGLHWSDPMPVIGRGDDGGAASNAEGGKRAKRLAGPVAKAEPVKAESKTAITAGALFFAPPRPAASEKTKRSREPKEKASREKVKVDPQLIARARELRDRYLEHVNAAEGTGQALLAPAGKYDVSRTPALAAKLGTERRGLVEPVSAEPSARRALPLSAA